MADRANSEIKVLGRQVNLVAITDGLAMSRKPKRCVTVELPFAFTKFMCEFNRRIEDGKEAATTIESDDLLQCDYIYGGLYDTELPRTPSLVYGTCTR